VQADALSSYISEEAGVDGEKARRGLSHARMQTIGQIPVDAAEAMLSVGAARSLRNLGKWSWRRYVPALALRFSVRRTSPTGTKSRTGGMMSH